MYNSRLIFIQHNVAKRHSPWAELIKLMQDLGTFYNVRRTVEYLREQVRNNEIGSLCMYLEKFADREGVLPSIIPIALIQEPITNRKGEVDLGNMKVFYSGSKPRACIATLPGINTALVSDLSLNDITTCYLSINKEKVYFISYYHDINIAQISPLLEQAVDRYKNSSLIIASDSNAHSSLWNSSENNRRGDNWEIFIANKGLEVMNDSIHPTFEGHLGTSHIDISLTNNPCNIQNWNNTEQLNGSDHCLILFSYGRELNVCAELTQNIANTDWQLFTKSLQDLYFDEEIGCTYELNFRAKALIANIKQAFDKACPPKRKLPFTPVKWWNKQLTTLSNKRKYAAREAKRFLGTTRGGRAIIKKRELGRLFQKLQRKARNEAWRSFVNNLTSFKQIASTFKKLRNNSKGSGLPFLSHNGNSARSFGENLDILRQRHFTNSSVNFSLNDGSHIPCHNKLPKELDLFMNLELLKRAVKDLPLGKAPGQDGIKNETLKRLPTHYLKELLIQYRASLAMAYIPPCWLEVRTIFIEKGGDKPKTDPKAYRPIGLSSTILKLGERLINWRLKTTVLGRGIPRQHAFTLGKSTETALSEVVHILEKAKYNNQKALVLSIDIQGAFDTIPFSVMKESLLKHEAEGHLVEWLDFLARNRKVCLQQGDADLSFRPEEGTTQGGHNGPDLWNISLWDIVTLETLSRSFICKYADDFIKAILGIDLKSMRDLLQLSLNEIGRWFEERGLKISAAKSYCLAFNTRRSSLPEPLTLNGTVIPFVKEFKYLGVILDSDLSWKQHIQARVKKAKRDLMAARRLISKSWGLNPGRMRWIYEGIVRACP